jgi:hypothetical protein
VEFDNRSVAVWAEVPQLEFDSSRQNASKAIERCVDARRFVGVPTGQWVRTLHRPVHIIRDSCCLNPEAWRTAPGVHQFAGSFCALFYHPEHNGHMRLIWSA